MKLQDLLRILRTRWITVALLVIAAVSAAIVYTVLQTPLYRASTRLFVSTTVGASASDLYQGNRLSQERVLSYTQLIMGETLAERTINRLNLDMDAGTLKANVTAKSKPDTVLIEVSVLDPSPVRARDIANALSDEFVLLVRQLETPTQGGPPDARVVIEQRAKVPEEPVVPKPVRNITLGFFLGAALGIGLALVRDLLDNTIKDRDALERISGTGVVGVVPFDKTRRLQPAIGFDKDNSAGAEAFRKLRTNLQFLSVDNPPRLIVVTSSMPNEGKTTTAINVALALAEADHKVLLVDGDMRRPSLGKYLDLVGSVGFSTGLSGAAALDDIIQQTKFPGLSVLAAGPVPPNPSELLSSISAKNLLLELRSKFDYVIVDSPPLLAVTDASILAAKADGTLLLARANVTKREQFAHSVRILSDVGANLLGAVLSMVPTRGSAAYRYDYSYYAHGYGERINIQE